MTFIHPYLLLGLTLAALPVVVHLLMRQKPKQVPFPAFRFLRQKAFTNRRRLRLQHLLLLLLRMLLIGMLCLGLSRPRVASEQMGLGNEKAVAAVLVFDTSMSMEYAVAGVSRLDEAKQRARELLDEMSEDSDLILLDSGDDTGGDPSRAEWLRPAATRVRVDNLQLRAANEPLTRQVERAYRLLRAAGEVEEPKPRFLFLFSDRTRESWDAAEAKRLEKLDGVTVVYVDVGVDKAADLAIEKVEVDPPLVAPGKAMQIRITVRATGADVDTKLTCQLDNEPLALRAPEEAAVILGKGQSKQLIVNRLAPALPEGVTELPVQVTAKLATNDALPFNNTRFATFLLREPRLILTIADDKNEARFWKGAITWVKTFGCKVVTPAEVAKFDAKAWAKYKVACLFETAQPSAGLWDRLKEFVQAGGGLCLVPGGADVKPGQQDYNRQARERGLLPASWETLVELPPSDPGFAWSGFNGAHPLTAPFRDWTRTGNPDFAAEASQPRVNGFWEVKPLDEKSNVIATYAEEKRRPILVERRLGQGCVLQFTTPFDPKPMAKNRRWHNYWDSSFGLVLVDLACKYLAGEAVAPELNFVAGVPPLIAPPPPPTALPCTLQGPNLAAAETNLAFGDSGAKLAVTQAVTPGNYMIKDGKNRALAGFSVNVRPEENQLERVPVEELDAVLGKDAVLPVGHKKSLQEALQGHWKPPLELMPWLMMIVLVALVMESLLANRFYKTANSTA